jgi:hypothetical protein
MTTDRSQILEATFTQAPAEIAGLKLRSFSLGSLSICRRVKLTMLTGEAAPETLTEDEKQQQIVAFLYIQSQPIPEVLKAIQSPRFFDETILPFSLTLPMEAFPQAIAEIQRVIDAASAAFVEVQPKPDEKLEDAHPNS